MWHLLEKISEQVTKYSTFLGQLWYILVFVFRLIVVVTIGGAVYSDEQSAFQCSTKVVGCENVCYNEFAKISHMRFWAFQLLAVATPTVFFHFYTMYVSGEIQKLKTSENQLRQMEEGEVDASTSTNENDFRKMLKRRKRVGHVKVRRIFSGNELKEVPYTNKIQYAYYLSIIFRLGMEGLFIFLGYLVFKKEDLICEFHPDIPRCKGSTNPFYFLWIEVPAMYKCTGNIGTHVELVCSMHVNNGGYIPCFVSRPFEKTVILRYMGVLSSTCFLISVLELTLVCARLGWKKSILNHKNLQCSQPHRRTESVFYSGVPSASSKYYDETQFYPSLAVPVRIASIAEVSKRSNNGQERPGR